MHNIKKCNTIKECLNWGTELLKSNNIDSPIINAEVLLCYALELSRIEIRLRFNEIISLQHKQNFLECIKSRIENIPLQYIIGKITFYNIVLNVKKSVFIPRAETEELVKIISTEINIHLGQVKNILDIGTGSGCIALSLANEFPNLMVDGVDISEFAIDCANYNRDNLNVKNVTFINIDFSKFCSNKKYDIIISNPPYISLDDYNKLDKELFFEPRIALTDEKDGLTFYRLIIKKLDGLLDKNGIVFLECGINQAEQINYMFNNSEYQTKIIKDFAGIDRFIIAKKM